MEVMQICYNCDLFPRDCRGRTEEANVKDGMPICVDNRPESNFQIIERAKQTIARAEAVMTELEVLDRKLKEATASLATQLQNIFEKP